jgi:hypothetical protein
VIGDRTRWRGNGGRNNSVDWRPPLNDGLYVGSGAPYNTPFGEKRSTCLTGRLLLSRHHVRHVGGCSRPRPVRTTMQHQVILPARVQPVPPAAISRVLARLDREQLAGFIEVAIELLDVAAGDPDSRTERRRRRRLESRRRFWLPRLPTAPGAPISDRRRRRRRHRAKRRRRGSLRCRISNAPLWRPT